MDFNKLNYFQVINNEMIQNICTYLRYNDLISLINTNLKNKELQYSCSLEYNTQKSKLNKFLLNLKRYKVIKSFEGTFLPIRLIKKFPILEFEDNYVGGTGYIDSVKYSHITDPIMIGLDSYNRSYIILKYYFNNKEYILTVFQRYSDSKVSWVKLGKGPILKMSNVRLNNLYKKQFIKNLCELLNRDKVTIIDDTFEIKKIDCSL